MALSPLPIDAVLPDLCQALRRHPNAVLRAPTGAGKTTRVPPALLDAGLAGSRQMLLIEPRRMATRAAARRMAHERGGRLGDEIGYQVRFERCRGPATRLVVVTPGILLRLLHDDPYLDQVSALLFDEFHERGLECDLALGLARVLQQTVRPDLHLLAMSATLAVDAVAVYLGDCPILTSEGRSFPVDIRHEPPHRNPVDAVGPAVAKLLHQTEGDLLVFLPGKQEIRQAAESLAALAQERDLAVLPLHGDLPPDQQDAVLVPGPRRRVILATNVAETSITVEGVTGVVDTGLARQLLFEPGVGLDRLQVVPISQAAALQRAGRAGRTQPGVCLRLWSEMNHRARAEQTEPEIRRVDLAGAVLQLLALGEKEVHRFPWLEPPTQGAIDQALVLLEALGALSGGALTKMGAIMARLPVHPRQGRLLIEGQRYGQVRRAALAASLLTERDPFLRPLKREQPGPPAHSLSDLLDRVEALEDFVRAGRAEFSLGTLQRDAARVVLRTGEQLVRFVRQEMNQDAEIDTASAEGVLRALLAAFPDRVVKRREHGGSRGVMVGGRGVRLAPWSRVIEPELFLAIDLDDVAAEALVRQASAIQRDWLPKHLVRSNIEVYFEESTERVQARKRLYYADLVLEEIAAAFPDQVQAAQVLIQAATTRLDKVLPPPESSGGLFLVRLQCLQQWMPELALPSVLEGDLRELLTWLAPRSRSFADLRNADWRGALRGRLSFSQQQALDREAPECIRAPSGSQIPLRYEVGRPPTLAVRIQELFGLAETPRIAAGRVKVLLHLLAPNHRPQQVTDDLASFWVNTYPQVRKDLRARYPKHAWPDNPLTAPAQRGPKRRGP